MIRCYRGNLHFEYKEDKTKIQILNLNTKIIENKYFIRHLKRFLQTLSVTGHLNAKHLNTITIVSVLAYFPGKLS